MNNEIKPEMELINNRLNINFSDGLNEMDFVMTYTNKFNTNIYGVKHLENLLACIKLFQYLNIEIKDYKDYINKFKGVKRRFEETIINGDIYIDDYAHHPTQIKYAIETIKNKYKEYELIVFFKPDRPSRFLTFYKVFAASFNNADKVILLKNKDIDVSLLIKENKKKFYKFNKRVIRDVKSMKKKVVVSFSSKNMNSVFESIFIK